MGFEEEFSGDYSADSSNTSDVAIVTIAKVVKASCMKKYLPKNFDFNRFYFISLYMILFTIGTVENICCLRALRRQAFRNRGAKLLLMNLTAANLTVALVVIPIEIVWRFTYVWPTNELGCRVLQFVRALGHYSTSMLLIVISIDRLVVLSKPFCRQSVGTIKCMLFVAWTVAIIFSSPHSVVNSLQHHPGCYEFIQCVPHNFFSVTWGVKAYNLTHLFLVYFIPLMIIAACYIKIMINLLHEGAELTILQAERSSTTAETSSEKTPTHPAAAATLSTTVSISGTGTSVDRHTITTLTIPPGRRKNAYVKTVKKSAVVILGFLFCWFPFVFIIMLTILAPASVRNMSEYAQDSCFILALSNCCFNPIVYGPHKSPFRKFYEAIKKFCS